MAQRWLFKTEPSTYSWADLERDRRTVWDGVKNALALKHLAAVATGDQVLIYHTGDEKAAVGIAKVVRGAYPDPKQKDVRLVVVDLQPVKALARPVALGEERAEGRAMGEHEVRDPHVPGQVGGRDRPARALDQREGRPPAPARNLLQAGYWTGWVTGRSPGCGAVGVVAAVDEVGWDAMTVSPLGGRRRRQRPAAPSRIP